LHGPCADANTTIRTDGASVAARKVINLIDQVPE
jgi:hypothetical protein